MKFFVAIFALAATTLALPQAEETYVADIPIDEALVEKFNIKHLSFGSALNFQDFSSSSRNAIDDKIIAFLENAREHFNEGFPAMGIPVLEPITVPEVSFAIYQKYIIKADMTFDDMIIAGLKSFVIENINFKIVGLTLSFDITLPHMVIDSDYSIKGKVASFIPFNPSGEAKLEADGINIKGVANLGTRADGTILIKKLALQLNIEGTKINLTGILGNGFINKTFNWVLNKLTPGVIQEHKDNVAEKAGELITEVANEFLSHVSLSDLISG